MHISSCAESPYSWTRLELTTTTYCCPWPPLSHLSWSLLGRPLLPVILYVLFWGDICQSLSVLTSCPTISCMSTPVVFDALVALFGAWRFKGCDKRDRMTDSVEASPFGRLTYIAKWTNVFALMLYVHFEHVPKMPWETVVFVIPENS